MAKNDDGSGGLFAVVTSGLRNAGFSAAAVSVNLVRSTVSGTKNFGSNVAARMVSGGAKVAGLSGGLISAKAGTALIAGASVLAPVTTVPVAMSVLGGNNPARYEVHEEEKCEALLNDPKKMGATGATADADMEAMAQQIYGALSYVGMGDENIAGILGNFETESGVDPTSVETIFDEPYEIGPKKQAAEATDFNGYRLGLQVEHAGIGLGQWTNERGSALREYAEDKNGDWFTVDVQLAYAMSEDSGSDIFQDMIAGDSPGSDDPGDAANFFLRKWERPADPDGNEPIRRKQASAWYAKMGAWDKDPKLGQSILNMAEMEGKAANNEAVKKELRECANLSAGASGGNADAAEAFVSFAWPMYEDSKGNDGTDLYQWLHGEILKDDPYKASCDRSVATAVLWSGTDDSFPKGAVSEQERYVNGEGKDKWEKITLDAHEEGNLEPGDILITQNHILMYLGEEAVAKVWPDPSDHTPNAVIGHGSLNDRSPGLDTFGGVTGDGRKFTAYRSKGPEKNSKFKDLPVPAHLKPGVGDPNGPLTTPAG